MVLRSITLPSFDVQSMAVSVASAGTSSVKSHVASPARTNFWLAGLPFEAVRKNSLLA